MFAATGSTMTAAMRRRDARRRRSTACGSLYGQHDRVAARRRGHARGARQRERREPGARLDEQAVAVAVVAARELHDEVAARRRRGRGGARSCTASVPEEVNRSRSIDGIASRIRSPSSHLGGRRGAQREPVERRLAHGLDDARVRRGRGSPAPHAPTKSRYHAPSASRTRAPSPAASTSGARPTARNARTGLLTPPGNRDSARRRRSAGRSAADAQRCQGHAPSSRRPGREVRGRVGDDEARAGAQDRDRRLVSARRRSSQPWPRRPRSRRTPRSPGRRRSAGRTGREPRRGCRAAAARA